MSFRPATKQGFARISRLRLGRTLGHHPPMRGDCRSGTTPRSARLRLWFLGILWVCLMAGRAWGLSVTTVDPAGYQAAALVDGSACYVDAAGTITGIPPALAGGTLIRTRAGDASNPSLAVSFQVDVRAEVYVCYESEAVPPTWLSSWVRTDMTVAVSDGAAASYSVYARRFGAGAVQLSHNQAGAMYFVVVKESLPILPRCGWVLLSYDMPYLREIIRQAPLYNVNHIQLSHDILMYTHQPLESPTLRADLNELIDLAHAYGITDVTVWTHEIDTRNIPAQCLTADGRVDGDKPEVWAWIESRYSQLFTTVCPELDGVVVTFSEVDRGCEVWNACLKFNGSVAEAVRKVNEAIQAACHEHDRTCYARTWAGEYQFDIRDAIQDSDDTTTWMMSKNVGGASGWDWQYMDTHLSVLGTLTGGYNELVEFDLCGEYLGRSQYTFAMAAYLKEHWNYAYNLGVRGGIVARIDREGALTNYTSNRINLYAASRILADRNADPAAVNLAWCRQYFAADATQDIADHYDDPGTSGDDTRLLTWEAFFPGLSPVTNTQALEIGRKAIGRLDKHRAQLEIQTTLDTRNRKTDYETLRNGIAMTILDLGGSVPEALGFSNFRPARTEILSPNCLVDVRLPAPGLKPSTASCEYSTNAGVTWSARPVTCSGSNGSTGTETIAAAGVPFNQLSEDRNFIRFHVADMNGVVCDSGMLRVSTVPPVVWSGSQPEISLSLTPDCTITVATTGRPLDPATARYQYSTDGGQSWITPAVNWEGRYECSKYPWEDGWAVVEGHTGYESVNNGILTINDNSADGNTKVKYARFWNADAEAGATVEARMQCLSGGHFFSSNLQLADTLHVQSLHLKANGIIGLYPTWTLVPANTTDWHVYRVTIRGTDLNVYVDGHPRPVLPANGYFHQPADTPQQLLFGSGASAGTQYINYDYLYWSTAGAFAPGPWQPAAYSGGPRGGTITASSVPFNQHSNTLNRIQFSINDAQGHAWQSPVYKVPISDRVVWADFDGDEDVDLEDFGHLQHCLTGSGEPYHPNCDDADGDTDGDVDLEDLAAFQQCITGANVPPDPNCEN